MMRGLGLVLALLATPALAATQPMLELGVGQQVGVTYQGPGDVVSGATAWYGLRAYNAAYATGTNKAINVRRASDNTTQDINILTTGALDIASANTFATQDATASCTSATTIVACTAASSTPHVGSTITGAGLTQPCYAISVGTFTAGAGSVTTNGCGTVSVAVGTTFQYGLYVTEAYDQTGNGHNASESTAAKQPQLLPMCPTLSCMNFVGSSTQELDATIPSTSQTFSVSAVGLESSGGTGNLYGNSNLVSGFASSTTGREYAGSFVSAGTTSASIINAMQYVFSGPTSIINANGTDNTVSPGTGAMGTTANLGGGTGANTLTGEITEVGLWGTGFSSGNRTSLCHNQFVYWATSASC